ncbi:MAG: hypothetical protein Q7R70_02880 [Candidatus Diapherotrites archaeon]|nr:hypothetical protein [Candidatus Diapherotrites archaeon]
MVKYGKPFKLKKPVYQATDLNSKNARIRKALFYGLKARKKLKEIARELPGSSVGYMEVIRGKMIAEGILERARPLKKSNQSKEPRAINSGIIPGSIEQSIEQELDRRGIKGRNERIKMFVELARERLPDSSLQRALKTAEVKITKATTRLESLLVADKQTQAKNLDKKIQELRKSIARARNMDAERAMPFLVQEMKRINLK